MINVVKVKFVNLIMLKHGTGSKTEDAVQTMLFIVKNMEN